MNGKKALFVVTHSSIGKSSSIACISWSKRCFLNYHSDEEQIILFVDLCLISIFDHIDNNRSMSHVQIV
jgi:hypothetical protein